MTLFKLFALILLALVAAYLLVPVFGAIFAAFTKRRAKPKTDVTKEATASKLYWRRTRALELKRAGAPYDASLFRRGTPKKNSKTSE